MKNKECSTCSERGRCRDDYVSWIFFAVGLVATIAIRAVVVLMPMGAVYAKIAWYIGVIGFLLFFLYKFRISRARIYAITQTKLLDNVGAHRPLSDEEYSLLDVILCALSSKKEMVNYMFIFIFSIAALVWAVYMDFIK